MQVRSSQIYDVQQYNKRGDHPDEHVWSVSTPILDEQPGEENKWPITGRLGTLDECDPENLRYSIITGKDPHSYFALDLGYWILSIDGKAVGAVSPERFKEGFETL
jgi:hypothetical protein